MSSWCCRCMLPWGWRWTRYSVPRPGCLHSCGTCSSPHAVCGSRMHQCRVCVSTAAQALRMLASVGARKLGLLSPSCMAVPDGCFATRRMVWPHAKRALLSGMRRVCGRNGWVAITLLCAYACSVYVASDDNSTASALNSWTQPKARGPSINFVQAPSPASFHVDQVPEGMLQKDVSQLFGQVVAEHLLLTMCTKWLVPKSGCAACGCVLRRCACLLTPYVARLTARFSVGAVMWANRTYYSV